MTVSVCVVVVLLFVAVSVGQRNFMVGGCCNPHILAEGSSVNVPLVAINSVSLSQVNGIEYSAEEDVLARCWRTESSVVACLRDRTVCRGRPSFTADGGQRVGVQVGLFLFFVFFKKGSSTVYRKGFGWLSGVEARLQRFFQEIRD